MKQNFILMLMSIIISSAYAAGSANAGAVSPSEKEKKDTLITIDATSGRADTTLTDFGAAKAFMSYEYDLFQKYEGWTYDVSGYAMKIVERKIGNITETVQTVLRANQVVDKQITRRTDPRIECGFSPAIELTGQKWVLQIEIYDSLPTVGLYRHGFFI